MQAATAMRMKFYKSHTWNNSSWCKVITKLIHPATDYSFKLFYNDLIITDMPWQSQHDRKLKEHECNSTDIMAYCWDLDLSHAWIYLSYKKEIVKRNDHIDYRSCVGHVFLCLCLCLCLCVSSRTMLKHTYSNWAGAKEVCCAGAGYRALTLWSTKKTKKAGWMWC